MPDRDDSSRPPDATVIRPRPGGARRGAAPGSSGPTDLPPGLQPAPQASAYGEPAMVSTSDLMVSGLNPLVQAASPLLLLAGRLRGTMSMPDQHGLKRHALDEIRRFETAARNGGVASEVVLAARYVICAAIDEAVLSTPWGVQSEWQQQPLLMALHKEVWGGEKFFDMLERTSADPTRHIDLMELQYLCLAFGFTGKYGAESKQSRGHSALAEVQQRLYRTIRQHRGVPPQELSLRWKGREDRRNRIVRYVPWWVVGAGALAILALTFGLFYARLGTAAEPVYEELARIGRERVPAPAPVVRKGPSLKQLLSGDESSGGLTVLEEGDRTIVTLAGADLFASGSATPNPTYDAILGRISAALNQVPGRVMVEGHTDDQPLHSLRYRNNFELSRERAVSVARVLQRTLTNPARVQWTGAGSSEPRYTPASTTENRARNRRVEIVQETGA
jgi:type VI secretion system protein ImpK